MSSVETPPAKTMRRWYEAKLAERLLQAAQMAKDRDLLRRGATKQQDGNLGTQTEMPPEEPVNIRIGDEIYYGQQAAAGPTPAQTQTATPPAANPADSSDLTGWKKAAAIAALAAAPVAAGAGGAAVYNWWTAPKETPAATSPASYQGKAYGVEVLGPDGKPK